MASPSDYKKNYQYPLINGACLKGDFVEYQSVAPHSDPSKPNQSQGVGPSACIRLTTSTNKGYVTTQLQTNAKSSCSNKLAAVNGTDTEHLIYGFGWQCLAVTDRTRWDTSEYTAVTGDLPTCETLNSGKDCIVRAPDNAAAGKCGADGGEVVSNSCGLIDKYINPLIKLMAGAVGLVVTIMVIVGGIEYSTAGGDPSRVTSAKKRIFNALAALVAFILLYAVLNWILPGGLR